MRIALVPEPLFSFYNMIYVQNILRLEIRFIDVLRENVIRVSLKRHIGNERNFGGIRNAV